MAKLSLVQFPSRFTHYNTKHMVKPIQSKKKGIRLKLVPRGPEGRVVFEPVSTTDESNTKLNELKAILGENLFQEPSEKSIPQALSHQPVPHVVEEEEDMGEVDIDIDPDNPQQEQIEILEALYEHEEEGELEDDFFQMANQNEFDNIMKEYDSDEDEEDPEK